MSFGLNGTRTTNCGERGDRSEMWKYLLSLVCTAPMMMVGYLFLSSNFEVHVESLPRAIVLGCAIWFMWAFWMMSVCNYDHKDGGAR